MRRSVVLFALIVLPAALLVTAFTTQAGDEAWIRGAVLNPQGREVEGAAVSLRPAQGGCRHIAGRHIGARTVTDGEGRFVLPRPPGDMEIYVSHPQFAPTWVDHEEAGVIRLGAASWLEGHTNTPALLSVGRGPWLFAHERVDGAFRCGPLPADMVLSVTAVSETHRPAFQRVVLGREEVRPLQLTLEPGASLRGRVVPAHAGAIIRAHGRDGQVFTATTTEDGTFTVTGLAPGWVRLVVTSPEHPLQVLDSRTGENVDVRWAQ